MIHRKNDKGSHYMLYFPVPPRLKPVNNPAESRSTPDLEFTVYPGEDLAEPRLSPVMPKWSPGQSVPAQPWST
ncbi:hypothetical protein DPMN_009725 [Dreissena polymorpha]|uniref:Uncharacterized protein n=1 Tax=Dreissena polymorpha TaxID=45954 RepID=A0A9D4N1S1_DREPO|nr:hypothetical protein DPMN_009725 [Dreissena polymorpha]